MKITHMVYVVVVFGIALSLVFPFVFTNKNNTHTYKTESPKDLQKSSEVAKQEPVTKTSDKELAIATTSEEASEPKVPEVIKTPEPVVAEAVYENLTMEELINKLNRSLKSNLTGTGNLFAKYAMENNVDPYLAVAIVLHETGCNWQCSAQVTQCNNVGGMKGAGSCQGTSYASFPSLEEGIKAFIVNLKTNYYDYGLNTPELMNHKYAASTAWAGKINSYIQTIKNS